MNNTNMMNTAKHSQVRALQAGLLAGVVLLYTAIIGMVEVFSERSIVSGIVTLGQLMIFVPALVVGFMAARRSRATGGALAALLSGFVAGLASAVPIILLLILAGLVDIRPMFVNVSQGLVDILTGGQVKVAGGLSGAALFSMLNLLGILGVLGLIGGIFSLIPILVRQPILNALVWVIILGLLSELLVQIIRPWFGTQVVRQWFQSNALRPITAEYILIGVLVASIFWSTLGGRIRQGYQAMPAAGRNLSMQAWGGPLGTGLIGLALDYRHFPERGVSQCGTLHSDGIGA